MCGLGHIFESLGISITLIGLVPQHVERMRPPRGLTVPFELGRPLGAPADAASQRSVLSAALSLLDRAGPGPVLERLDTAATAAGPADEPWVCPVAFPAPRTQETLLDQLLREVALLEPWFDRGRRDRGCTAVVSATPMAELCHWLCEFLGEEPPNSAREADQELGAAFKLAVEDLKTFYLEAATAQPGAGRAAEIGNWFWNETVAGELLRDLSARLKTHPDRVVQLHASFTLVPQAQLRRDPRPSLPPA